MRKRRNDKGRKRGKYKKRLGSMAPALAAIGGVGAVLGTDYLLSRRLNRAKERNTELAQPIPTPNNSKAMIHLPGKYQTPILGRPYEPEESILDPISPSKTPNSVSVNKSAPKSKSLIVPVSPSKSLVPVPAPKPVTAKSRGGPLAIRSEKGSMVSTQKVVPSQPRRVIGLLPATTYPRNSNNRFIKKGKVVNGQMTNADQQLRLGKRQMIRLTPSGTRRARRERIRNRV